MEPKTVKFLRVALVFVLFVLGILALLFSKAQGLWALFAPAPFVYAGYLIHKYKTFKP